MKNEEIKKKNNVKKKVNIEKEEVKIEVDEEIVEKEEKNVESAVVVKKSKKKKGDKFLVLGLVLVILLGMVVLGLSGTKPTYELPLTLEGDAGLQQLTYSEYQDKIDNGDEFVVILERATCGHCVTYMPIAEQFATDNNVPMYYVDTDTFGDDDWNGFERSNSYLRKANGNWGTPTTLVQAGSSTVDFIEGATTVEALLELYNNNFKMAE